MALLVNFVAVENKADIVNTDKYVANIYNCLLEAGLIDSLVITPSELGSVSNPIKEIDEEGNIFIVDFIGEEDDVQYTMQISFEFRTYNGTKQLDISITSNNYRIDSKKTYLEKLKLEVKKAIVKDWKEIIWLIDRDSECLSIELYPQLYKTENLFRELINQVMNIQYGTSWWDMIVPYEIKDKHRARLKEYKAKVPSFNNVDDRLMSIDIDDLAIIITTIRYKWNPSFTDEISSLISGVQKYNDNKIRELLEKQRIEEINLWKDQFSRYLPDDFVERFKVFAKDRNHIMHNKLIDRSAANMIKVNATTIESDLNKAIEILGKTILSEEEKENIEKQKQIEYEMLEELDHDCRENDAGVSIRSVDDIMELFEDTLSEIVTNVEDEFRFRNDIELITQDAYSCGYSGEIFRVKSKIDGNELCFKFTMEINDEEGSTSELTIFCNSDNTNFSKEIVYTNGEVEYDSDSGLYMAVTQDEIDSYIDAKEEIIECIEETFVDYKEKTEPDDIAEFVSCAECGEDSICINPDLFPVGTCLSCGYVNKVCQCVRCEEWFNSEIDGEYNEEDEFAMCQNCLDAAEAE